jgi:hypothetical protein
VETLSELSDRGKPVDFLVLALFMKTIAEFRPSIVTAIPEIVTLLKDSDIDVCKACVIALLKFSEQGKTDFASNLDLLMRIIAEFRAFIGPAVLDMVKSLNIYLIIHECSRTYKGQFFHPTILVFGSRR